VPGVTVLPELDDVCAVKQTWLPRHIVCDAGVTDIFAPWTETLVIAKTVQPWAVVAIMVKLVFTEGERTTGLPVNVGPEDGNQVYEFGVVPPLPVS